jgi:hypothetical protein
MSEEKNTTKMNEDDDL